MKQALQSIRSYCDYVEEHIDNVNKAWQLVQDKCQDLDFMKDQDMVDKLHSEINKHDKSKLSHEEFIPYVMKFFPSASLTAAHRHGIVPSFDKAWNWHKISNPHHWQVWTEKPDVDKRLNCIHMVIDWMAMGFKFNDTARDYYEKNKDKIDIPDWAVKLCYEIFDKVYGEKK